MQHIPPLITTQLIHHKNPWDNRMFCYGTASKAHSNDVIDVSYLGEGNH